MHVDTVYLLRQALLLDPPDTPVKVIEPYQMLGEIKEDLVEVLGVDVVPLRLPTTMFGFKNEGWKPWKTFAGTPVLVPRMFNTDVDANGDLYMYAGGDQQYPPSARMPAGGFYFDSLTRQEPIDDSRLCLEDNLEEFGLLSDEELNYLGTESRRLFDETDKAIVIGIPGTSFGDIALVPGPMLKNPKGIRGVEEWYISTVSRRDFINRIFVYQCDIALQNLSKIYDAVGNRPTVAFVTGTDFGAQHGSFISPHTFRSLYRPHFERITDWIHRNTQWKVFVHSCGSIRPLLPEFAAAGFEVLNPVQTSAAHMDPMELKAEYGERFTFWGGGVDTQRTLPFATPDEVRSEVRERLQIFGKGGGYVFNTIHNVQALVPIENVLAMYETVKEYGDMVGMF
jgi:hypothetical protein